MGVRKNLTHRPERIKMDTSCKKVILGLFVLDKIITSESERSFSINAKNSDLSLGGPPTFMLFISNIFRELIPAMEEPILFAYISKQTRELLDNLSIFEEKNSQLISRYKSPNFILDYSRPSTERNLMLFDPPGEFNCNPFIWQFDKPPILIISSVYQEFNSYEIFSFLRNKGSFLVFDPQGCFRKISSDGKIFYSEWFSREILSQINCIKLADSEAILLGLGNDLVDITQQLLAIASNYVIITKGRKGALLGIKSTTLEKISIFSVPSYPVNNVINETGAGDVFLYSFISFLQILEDELEAIAYATSLASLLIEYGFDKEKYMLHEIKYRQKVIRSRIKNISLD